MKKLICATLLFLVSAYSFGQTVFEDYADGKINVRFVPSALKGVEKNDPNNLNPANISALSQFISKYGITKAFKPFYRASDDKALPNIVTVVFTQKNKVSGLIEELSLLKGIVYAEKVPLMKTSATPNDPSYGSQAYLTQINAPNAWNIFNGNSNITVAIVDNAVKYSHQDLAGNTYTNSIEAAGVAGVDDDGNGYIDDINGFDVADDDNNAIPTNNAQDHGTHCAGIAGARTNNGIGIASIGWNLKIIPVKCSSDGSPVTSIDNGYGGIVYAAKAGARVISCSWGGGGGGQAGQDVINYAWNKGCIIVAAAGNANTSTPSYPGAYNKVYCVASCGLGNVKSGFSNYGAVGNQWVDIIAPGENILSTLPNNGVGTYGQYSGTSMATPLVAGLAGMILSVAPLMTQTAVLNCISSTAVNIYTIAGNSTYSANMQLGAGRIEAFAAMSCASGYLLAPPVANFYSLIKNTCPNTPVNFVDSTLYLYLPATWSWSFQAGTPAVSSASAPVVQWSAPGIYSVAMTVTTPNGNSSITKVSYINVTNPIALPLSEGFQTLPFLPSNWTPYNANNDNIYWARTTSCGGFGTSTACALFDNAGYDASGERDAMLTPKYDFSNVAVARLRFDVAYKFYNNTYSDTLRVNLSNDCASSWTNIYQKGGASLATAPGMQVPLFVPAAGQWRRDSVDISALTAGQGNIMMSFVNHGHYGQGIYVDNINLFFPAPAVSFATPSQACSGFPVTYTNTSIGAGSYTWAFQGATPATSTLSNPSVTYPAGGVFVTTLTAQNGTTTSFITQTITVNATPVITVNDEYICPGGTATVTASGATSYTWSNGFAGNPLIVSPPSNTVFSVSSETLGCTGMSTVNVYILPVPSAIVNVTNTTCNGCMDGEASVNAFGALAPYTYLWMPAGGTSSLATGLSNECYSVQITSSNSCVSTKTLCVDVTLTIGIQKNSLSWSGLDIYPNPANDFVTLDLAGKTFNINLYNSVGQLIFSKKSNFNQSTINVSELSKGLYTMVIECGEERTQKKLAID